MKELKPLKNYLLYFLVGLLICIVGISGVFAESITDMQFSTFRTYSSTYSIVSNQYIYDTTSAVPVDLSATADGFPFEWVTSYSMNCTGQTNISGSLAIPNTNLNYDWLQDNIKDIYYSTGRNNSVATTCSWSVNSSTLVVSFSCSTSEPVSNFIIGGHLRYRSNSTFSSYFRIYRDFNITCDNSANAIINNQQQNTQNIINNQNQNTQQQIESQKVCTDTLIDKEYIIESNKVLNSSGGLQVADDNYGITDYINIKDKNIEVFKKNTWSYSCFYQEDKTLLNCFIPNTEGELTVPSNAYYIRASIYNATNIPQYKITECKNGNQALSDDNKEAEKTRKGIFNKLKELFNFFNNDGDADTSGLNNMAGWLPPGPLDSIINLPLNLFNALTTTLSGTCNPVQLTLPFVNQQLTLPCFDSFMSANLTGFSTIWTFIGVTVSVFILYNYLLTLYKWVDDTLTLRENNLPGYYDDNWGGGA